MELSPATNHILHVLVRPKEGREEEWWKWHTDRHQPDMLEVPGVKKCYRFEKAPIPANEDAKWVFMMIYELETDDPQAVLDEVARRTDTELMPMSPACDRSKTVIRTWVPLSSQLAGG